MKPTTEDVLKWAREAKLTLNKKQNVAHLEAFAALAYAAGAADMNRHCEMVIPPQYHEIRDRIRALGEKNE